MAKRTTKRRVVYRDRTPVEVAEPVKSGFTLGWLVNLGGVPLITAALTFAGFYYGTNYRLESYGEQIKAINAKLEISSKVIADKSSDDTAQREKIREAFLTSQTKTNEGIAKLDTRLAVAEKQQETANTALNKISETLSTISSFSKRH